MRAAKATGPLPVFTWDPQRLRLVSANPEGLRFWGEDSLTDLNERIFAPGDETVRALAARLAEIEEGSDGDGPLIFTPSCSPILTSAACRREADPNGRVLLRVTLTDIRPPDDAVLARMRAGFDAAPQAMAIIDRTGRLLARNEADRRSFGFDSGTLAARLQDAEEAEGALAAALSDGALSRKVNLRATAGTAAFRVSLRRMRDPVEGKIAAIAEFTDLADRQPTEAPPEGHLSAQELAAYVHDLRAPLTAIQGFAEFMDMCGAEMTADQRAGYLADIRTAALRMQSVIDGVIAGAAPQAEPVLLAELLATSVSLYQPQAQASGMALQHPAIAPGLSVKADRVTLSRIIDNLINNALTHGAKPGGAVEVSAHKDSTSLIIEIRDDGPGMDEAMLSTALKPYGAAQPSGRHGGLGLSNCVSLAKEIGARLNITTAPGQGFSARLIFTLVCQRRRRPHDG